MNLPDCCTRPSRTVPTTMSSLDLRIQICHSLISWFRWVDISIKNTFYGLSQRQIRKLKQSKPNHIKPYKTKPSRSQPSQTISQNAGQTTKPRAKPQVKPQAKLLAKPKPNRKPSQASLTRPSPAQPSLAQSTPAQPWEQLTYKDIFYSRTCVADPRSGTFLIPGSGLSFFRIPDLESRIPDFGSLTIFMRA